jgi:hypothetical protein
MHIGSNYNAGADPGFQVRGDFFWRKIVIFHMKYPKNFARPPKIGKI